MKPDLEIEKSDSDKRCDGRGKEIEANTDLSRRWAVKSEERENTVDHTDDEECQCHRTRDLHR